MPEYYINISNLDYGSYVIMDGSSAYTENVKYASAEFNKLYVRKVRLPDGTSNIIYLLADTFEGSLRMVSSGNFIIPPTYRRFYYPWISFGNFMGRRYKMNLTSQKIARLAMIRDRTKLLPTMNKDLHKSRDNVFFSVADLFENIKPIMERYPITRVFNEFFGEFDKIISGLTPEPEKSKKDDQASGHRMILIDADSFKFKEGAPIKDNQTNPLFLLYLAFLRTRDLSKLNVDKDFLITSRNMFMKFNPAKTSGDMWSKFRIALFKIMNANLDNYTDTLAPEEKEEILKPSAGHITHNIIDKSITPYTKFVSPATKGVLGDAIDSTLKGRVDANASINRLVKDEQEVIAKNIKTEPKKSLFQRSIEPQDGKSLINANPYTGFTKQREEIFNAIVKDYQPLVNKVSGQMVDEKEEDLIKGAEDIIQSDVNDILYNDEGIREEVLNEIQDKTAPMKNLKTAPVYSARDLKLREAQKKLVVKGSTIEDILERDAKNIPIKVENKSTVLKTSNKNMHNIKFANFEKTYLEELYIKDIVGCFDMLKDKNSKFHITGIEHVNTSDTMNLKETWTVHLVDENKKRHTLKVDIPLFYDDRFMLIGGNKYMILKQNFYNPLVKDMNNTVILTTNFNKITIQRKATKSLETIERIFSLMNKIAKSETADQKVFISGDSSKGNASYISSLEYDELSRRIFHYSSNGCQIWFSRDYIMKNMESSIPKDIKGDEFFIGFEDNQPILINEDTGRDRLDRMITDIIVANLSADFQALYKGTKSPKQAMFAEGKIAGHWLPVVVTLLAWVGISKMLDKMKIVWKFNPDMKRVPKENTGMSYIRFADGVLEYEPKIFADLILNGLNKLNPSTKTFSSFNTEECYSDYIYYIWGNYNGIVDLANFYEFLIDPITRDVCRDLFFPTEPDELLIEAVKLLSDNSSVSKASDQSYRTRSIETVPAILYSLIASQYKSYVKNARRVPMTIKQNAVIQVLQEQKTIEEYSTLNPAIEIAKTHSISTKGFKGSNSEHSYRDEQKRSYDPSSIGKLAMSTSADANVGINRELVVEPTISNARGYRDQVDDINTLTDVNIFSGVEMLTPGTARVEDPIRTAIANKQSQHLVSVENASPSLVSNGFDEALQFHLSNDFVINAEEDGQVVEVNEEVGFIMVQYKSGKHFAINTNVDVVKNSGGGFFTSNLLKPRVTKVGEKFKKDEVLAYHDKYFTYSPINGLRYAIGPLAKVAFMSTYNTYEDAGICTISLADKMKTKIVYKEDLLFKKNANIISIVKVGDHVGIGDTLVRYDSGSEDDEMAKYLTRLASEENRALFEEETKDDIKSHYAGVVIDIKLYTLHDPSNLSPSLGELTQAYFDKGLNKKAFLEKYDSSPGIVKAGYLFTDNTEPLVTRYNDIKGYKGRDVLIEIYIEHPDTMKVGDKIAIYSANKQIISEVIPEGYEPYSEFRPEEEISALTSPGTISRRMTPAVIPISAATKVLIELKRKIKAEIKYSK